MNSRKYHIGKMKIQTGYISFTLMFKNTLQHSVFRRRNVPHRFCWRLYCWHQKVAATILLATKSRSNHFVGTQLTATIWRRPIVVHPCATTTALAFHGRVFSETNSSSETLKNIEHGLKLRRWIAKNKNLQRNKYTIIMTNWKTRLWSYSDIGTPHRAKQTKTFGYAKFFFNSNAEQNRISNLKSW